MLLGKLDTAHKKHKFEVREGLTISFETSHFLCGTFDFMINDEEADQADFGRMADADPSNAPEYGCGNYGFDPHYEIPKGVLDKYKIAEDDFRNIGEILETELHVGMCAMCA